MRMQLPVTNTTHFDILLIRPVFTLSFTLALHPASTLPGRLTPLPCHALSVPTSMLAIKQLSYHHLADRPRISSKTFSARFLAARRIYSALVFKLHSGASLGAPYLQFVVSNEVQHLFKHEARCEHARWQRARQVLYLRSSTAAHSIRVASSSSSTQSVRLRPL